MKKITIHNVFETILIVVFTVCGVFAMFSGHILLTMFGFLFAITGVMWFHSIFIKPKYPEDR